MICPYFRPFGFVIGLLVTLCAGQPGCAVAQTAASPSPRPEATATPTPPRTPASGDPTFFGKVAAPTTTTVTTDGKSVTRVAVPPPAAPVLTRPTTGVAAGIGGGSTTPVPTPAATVAETPALALTPVGKWRWHAGGDHTLTEKGAVLEGAKVVGQWKWLDKSKAQIQVQWTGSPYRPPMTYTLSVHGNHLSGKSPSSGQDHTEDRIE